MSGDRDAFFATHDVSRETAERLQHYADLLAKWSRSINLVSASTLPSLWGRHFADSAQLLRLAPLRIDHWVDLGSGAGFPGLIVAILGADSKRIDRVTLVEADLRKATFLKAVVRELGLDVQVLPKRIEELEPLYASILSARALSSLKNLLGHAEKHLLVQGHAIFPKGKNHRTETNEALESWRFHCDTFQSLTDKDAVILRISEIQRA